MAKKKKKKGGAKTKYRYITKKAKGYARKAAPKKSNFQDILLQGAIAAGGGVVSGILSQKIPMPNPRLKPLIPIAGGLLLGSTGFGKDKIGKSLAIGMVAAGALAFAKSTLNLPVLAGDDELTDYEYYGDSYSEYDDADLMGYDYEEDDSEFDEVEDYYGEDYQEFSGSDGWKTNY